MKQHEEFFTRILDESCTFLSSEGKLKKITKYAIFWRGRRIYIGGIKRNSWVTRDAAIGAYRRYVCDLIVKHYHDEFSKLPPSTDIFVHYIEQLELDNLEIKEIEEQIWSYD